VRRFADGGSGKKAERGRGNQRLCQMAAAKLPQTGEHISQIVIFDIRCRGIQSIRCAGGEVVDGLAALVPCGADGRGSRMERVPGIIARLIQFPGGGSA
jgi:hypothetical protein